MCLSFLARELFYMLAWGIWYIYSQSACNSTRCHIPSIQPEDVTFLKLACVWSFANEWGKWLIRYAKFSCQIFISFCSLYVNQVSKNLVIFAKHYPKLQVSVETRCCYKILISFFLFLCFMFNYNWLIYKLVIIMCPNCSRVMQTLVSSKDGLISLWIASYCKNNVLTNP